MALWRYNMQKPPFWKKSALKGKNSSQGYDSSARKQGVNKHT